MKVAYIIGPYRAANAWEIEQNIRRAEEVALELWRAGFAVICPHTNTRFFQGAAPDAVWLDGFLEIIGRCDFVVSVHGWIASEGSINEVIRAKSLKIPRYDWSDIKDSVACRIFIP